MCKAGVQIHMPSGAQASQVTATIWECKPQAYSFIHSLNYYMLGWNILEGGCM